ncbi:IS110 family transposase [Streptomyces sp. NBC_01224]|uniref:hypothetical protein n=1 Tax=unclassified Streptomyces TaxID=2593676 RepID=UPI002E10DC7E|nr:IS110 family transposase [Streptomyces sp. NBC_01224]
MSASQAVLRANGRTSAVRRLGTVHTAPDGTAVENGPAGEATDSTDTAAVRALPTTVEASQAAVLRDRSRCCAPSRVRRAVRQPWTAPDAGPAHPTPAGLRGRRVALATAKLPEGAAGIAKLHELLARRGEEDLDPAGGVVGIETDRGSWVQALIASGYQVFAINPRQVNRFKERYASSGAKSGRRSLKHYVR